MKVVWVTNVLLNKVSVKQFGKVGNGLWMDSILPAFEDDSSMQLTVITPCSVEATISHTIDGVQYYLVPQNRHNNMKDTPQARQLIRKLLQEIQPDIMTIWGTERPHSYLFFEVAKELQIPSVVFVQGLLEQVAAYSKADMSYINRICNTTLRDIYRQECLLFEKKHFQSSAKYERKILTSGVPFIYENEWCRAHAAPFGGDQNGYRVGLPINAVFSEQKKEFTDKPHDPVIMCNASGYPLKGLHITLRALALLKEKYPQIRLIVPGTSVLCPTDWIRRQRYPAYYVYISKLIRKWNLEDNVVFTGPIDQTKLAQHLLSADAFVLASSLENHSSSLREAMTIGLPCVASWVGGVGEHSEHGENVLHYRFGDYKMMAHYLDLVLSDPHLAQTLGENARKRILDNDRYALDTIYKQFTACYQHILETKGK